MTICLVFERDLIISIVKNCESGTLWGWKDLSLFQSWSYLLSHENRPVAITDRIVVVDLFQNAIPLLPFTVLFKRPTSTPFFLCFDINSIVIDSKSR